MSLSQEEKIKLYFLIKILKERNTSAKKIQQAWKRKI